MAGFRSQWARGVSVAGWFALALMLAGFGLLLLARPAHAEVDESADSTAASTAPAAAETDPVAAPASALADAAAPLVVREPGAPLTAGCILMVASVVVGKAVGGKARRENGIGIRGDTQAGNQRSAMNSNRLGVSNGAALLGAGARAVSVRLREALCGLSSSRGLLIRVPTAISTG